MTKENGNIRGDRKRTNILKEAEYTTIEALCAWIPNWVTPDMLTAFGVLGAVIVFGGLQLALFNKYFLFMSIAGLGIHWFGDSLDGRLAYYRKTPRKWYGWALDIHADWLSTIIIGLGFYYYLPQFKIIAFIFVVAYGGSMIIALLRYKIANKYIIDSNQMGPTELRIILACVLIGEVFYDHVLLGFGIIGSILLILFNCMDSLSVLRDGDIRDEQEKGKKKLLGQAFIGA